MTKKIFAIPLATILLSFCVHAQSPIIEKVIIDTFYVSSAKDTGIFENGYVQSLPEGSITHRIFIDLAEGVKLLKVFGNEQHPYTIKSTELFFNNTDRGEVFGYSIRANKLNENSLLVDSWFTFGFASNKHLGILKSEDDDGISPIANNTEDLLINSTNAMGISLQEADGLLENNAYDKANIKEFGFTMGNLSVALDNDIIGTEFSGNNVYISYADGMVGPTISNTILIAQITTKGTISFTCNIEVMLSNGETVQLFGTDTLLGEKGIYSPWLQYPFNLDALYGCTDPFYAEYSPSAMYDNGSCKTKAVFGCLDETACNFNPKANKHRESLCCYDSKCALDLDVVCPGTVYGCTDPEAANYNPLANKESETDACIYCNNIGCMDEAYIEFDAKICYHDSSACKTLRIGGCMDKTACNYNPVANVEQNESCLYDCEKMKSEENLKSSAVETDLTIYPLPTAGIFYYDVVKEQSATINISVTDIHGKIIREETIANSTDRYIGKQDLSDCKKGLYFFNYSINGVDASQIIIVE